MKAIEKKQFLYACRKNSGSVCYKITTLNIVVNAYIFYNNVPS